MITAVSCNSCAVHLVLGQMVFVFKIMFLVILFLKMAYRGQKKTFLPGGIFFIDIFLVCLMMTSYP